MTTAATTLLSLIILSLGLLGVILSFLVPDRKKATLSLVLAGVIIVLGIFQFIDQSISRYRVNRRMQEIQKEQQLNLDQLRDKLKAQAPSPSQPASAPKK